MRILLHTQRHIPSSPTPLLAATFPAVPGLGSRQEHFEASLAPGQQKEQHQQAEEWGNGRGGAFEHGGEEGVGYFLFALGISLKSLEAPAAQSCGRPAVLNLFRLRVPFEKCQLLVFTHFFLTVEK